MKSKLTTAITLLVAGIGLTASIWAQQTPAAKPATASPSTATHKAAAAAKPAAIELKTEKEKASYALGMNIGDSVSKKLQLDGLAIDHAIFLRGMKDALNGDKLLLTDDVAKAAFTAYQKEAKDKQDAKMKTVGDENKKEGDAFLAANKAKPGITTTESGLQYKVEKQGDGPKPTATDTVEVNYRGTLINGKEFDSSAKHGQTATFPVNRVIKGWTEILQLMPVGSKYQIYVPSELAYGPRGAGGDIGPNATLIFDVELLTIKPKTPAMPAMEKPAPTATAPDMEKPVAPPPAPKPAEPAK
jgi:FKBP-type peptidyl-prolyl cis-trans isomerase